MKIDLSRSSIFIFISIGLIILFVSGLLKNEVSAAQPLITAIASNNDNQQKFYYFGQPAIDTNNDTVFPATTSSSEGIFKFSNGLISKVISTGDSSPIGGKFSLVSSPSINSGKLVFYGSVYGGHSERGIFEISDGIISKIVAVDDPAPTGGSFTDFGFSKQSINKKGDFVFYGFTNSQDIPGNGLFESSNGTISKIVKVGDKTPIGGIFMNIKWSIHPINDNGDIVFQSYVSGGTSSQGIFKSSDGKISPIISSTDTNANGVLFTRIEAPSINNNGDIVFFGGNTGLPSSKGIYMISNGHVSKVLSIGDPTPIGGTFSKMGAISINDRGEIVFLGFISNGPSNYGIFKISGKKMLHAVNGDVYSTGEAFSSVSMPAMNNHGLVAFSSYMNTTSQKLFVMNSNSNASSIGGK